MKKVLTAILIGTVFLISGCIDFQQDITLNKDGSGTISYQMKFDKSYLAQFEDMDDGSSMSESPDEEVPTEEEIKATLKKHPGVKLISYLNEETETETIWQIKFAFESIAALHAMDDDLEMASTGNETPSGPTWTYTKQDDGTWLFEQDMEGGGPSASEGEESGAYTTDDDDAYYAEEDESAAGEEDEYEMPDSAAMAEMMRQMVETAGEYSDEYAGDEDDESAAEYSDSTMTGGMEEFAAAMEEMMASLQNMKVKITVTLPGEIIESNATKIDGNTAIWEYAGSEAMEASSILSARVKQ